MTYREIIERIARMRGRHPLIVEVPILPPRLSSWWLMLVTPVQSRVARPLVEGLRTPDRCARPAAAQAGAARAHAVRRGSTQCACSTRGARSTGMTGIRLGYACVNTQLTSPARTARLSNVTDERISELVDANLGALEVILRWNRSRGIQVFRLTSNLIPFGSHPANTLPWWGVFADRLARLGRLMRSAGMRISTHPGQYIVLSSTREDVVAAAVAELGHHDRLLSAFGLDRSHKIVLHLGAGVATRARPTTGSRPGIRGSRPERPDGSSSRTTSAGRSTRRSTGPSDSGSRSSSTRSTTSSPHRWSRSRSASWCFEPRRRGRLATAARRCISRPRHRESDQAHTRRRSTSMPSPGSPRTSATYLWTASSRSRTRSARCCGHENLLSRSLRRPRDPPRPAPP